jgi:serine/threonine-protein kinase
MGQVFEAHDINLQRLVAIKAGRPGVSVQFLCNEAIALASLRHPSMVDVHYVGEHKGIPYVVMERLYGMSLQAHLERASAAADRFQVEEVVDVLIGIAEGLRVAHRAGLAHRDLKPANVMLAAGNRVVLMDFGLGISDVDLRRRQVLVASGTPAYMAPESIRNSLYPGVARMVDVYALGVIAYEMLAGKRPFAGDRISEIFEGHLFTDAPPLEQFRTDLPRPLAKLVDSLLAKDRADRPDIESVLWQLRAIRLRQELREREGFSVLIADDDDLVQTLLGDVVLAVTPDAQIRRARSGRTAIESVRRELPDVVLLDLNMPDLNGFDVCMYLRGTKLAERCRVIAISSSATEQDCELLRQLDVYFLPKGPTFEEDVAPLLRSLRHD